ncbi:hypothetical protein ACNKHP_25080 [Shigella boydii]
MASIAAGSSQYRLFLVGAGNLRRYTIPRLIFALSETGKAWKTKKNNSEIIPEFDKSFATALLGSMAGRAAMAGIALTPPKFRDPILARLGRFAGRLGKSSRRRALIDLSLCFPERSEAEREAIVDEMFATAPQVMATTAELAIRGPEKVSPRVDWQGLEIIEEMRRNNDKLYLFWCRTVGPSIFCHADGLARAEMAAMFHNQGNPVFDYVGTRRVVALAVVCMRQITTVFKRFIQSVRQGYWT